MQVMDQRYPRVAKQSFALLVPLALILVAYILEFRGHRDI